MALEWNSTSSTTGLLPRVLGSEPATPLSTIPQYWCNDLKQSSTYTLKERVCIRTVGSLSPSLSPLPSLLSLSLRPCLSLYLSRSLSLSSNRQGSNNGCNISSKLGWQRDKENDVMVNLKKVGNK